MTFKFQEYDADGEREVATREVDLQRGQTVPDIVVLGEHGSLGSFILEDVKAGVAIYGRATSLSIT